MNFTYQRVEQRAMHTYFYSDKQHQLFTLKIVSTWIVTGDELEPTPHHLFNKCEENTNATKPVESQPIHH